MLPGKLGVNKYITSAGSLGEFDIDIDNTVRFSISNAGPTFAITISGRILGQQGFTLIETIVGNGLKDIDTSKWDFLQIDITTYDSLSNHVQVSASGFIQSLAGVSDVFITNFPASQDVVVTAFPEINKFAPPQDADYIGATYNLTSDVYVYKVGGSSGTLLKTLTITYTDSTKENILSVEVV